MRRAAAVLGVLAAILAGLLILTAIAMRIVPDDPARWHVDPLAAERTGKPNDYLVAPAALSAATPDRIAEPLPISPAELMAAIDAVALGEPRTTRLAGRPEELAATYVRRSRLFGFPDYVSIRAVEVPGGSAPAIWSRARFGRSDMGVNRARVERWLAAVVAGG